LKEIVLKLVGKLLPVWPPVVPRTRNVAPEATERVPPDAERFVVKVERFNVPDVTVRLPVIDVLTPSVVVPPLIVRLLKDVKIVEGSVFVAVISTVPVPGVHVVPLCTVIAPPTRSVPPLVIVMLLACPDNAPSARLPA
jgi:hypothetical protein